ncbi:MAG TPA: rhodanese-like domain-containing protein [Methyloceanibacter sp.]|nr:rhodanese-like domain-containing protein [Methyloceanibacter sp.]
MSLPTIDPTDAKRLIEQGATLIDIRGADERAREHIPGSHHGPLAQMTNYAGVNAPIIFHCRSGMRTANNAARLKEAAPCEAYILSGGIDAWKQAGLPVVTDKSQPIEIFRQVMIGAGSLILAFVLLGAFAAPAFYGLAGLVGVGLVFGGVSGWCGMAKLLEVMPWNRPAVGA